MGAKTVPREHHDGSVAPSGGPSLSEDNRPSRMRQAPLCQIDTNLLRHDDTEQTPNTEPVMSAADGLVNELRSTLKFFKTTLSVFESEDEGFAPNPDMYTVAGQVAHTASSVGWFIEGGFGDGWDLDFEADIAKAKAVTSLDDAVARLDRAFDNAIEVVAKASDEELFTPIADTSIMGDAPRAAVISGIVDHTAHHRGSLAVYARLVGKVPLMPYS